MERYLKAREIVVIAMLQGVIAGAVAIGWSLYERRQLLDDILAEERAYHKESVEFRNHLDQRLTDVQASEQRSK